ncbi:hypothetical protein T440DRAFT_67809 [Plenodomus tracheiphilus IPT5]|uniref:Uncharacterized protein n=1 Tax=Plenodomus tracheiphilus IPT5 TaxID=1408161 RepID=A0A6A7API1_9PLEO|nr:hypothetical protein T440DRAFT_67809 [Plenodomus tracheiphilus IPT5]
MDTQIVILRETQAAIWKSDPDADFWKALDKINSDMKAQIRIQRRLIETCTLIRGLSKEKVPPRLGIRLKTWLRSTVPKKIERKGINRRLQKTDLRKQHRKLCQGSTASIISEQ